MLRGERAEPMPVTVEVELDIFSGRPNPRWVLSATDAHALTEQLAALPAAQPGLTAANLGYRGFVVDIADAAGSTRLQVQGGSVHSESPGAPREFRRDAGRALERWLLDTGTPHLDAPLIELMARLFPADRP